MITEKQQWPHAEVMKVADELQDILAPACERICAAGSLRRQKPFVGDVELLYVPRLDEAKLSGEFFPQPEQNLADLAIDTLLLAGVLAKRLNAKGQTTFGPQNKFVRHVASGLPMDLFATTEPCWFNYLVCRTGGLESNLAICRAATERGWNWAPYRDGFRREPTLGNGARREKHVVTSERDVFEFVGLPYREPKDRP